MEKDMNRSVLSFPVEFEKVEEVQIKDERFTKVKIWMMHTGKNYNKSIFEKDIVENAIGTIEYIPIVGFIEEKPNDENDFSDHRYVITKDINGVHRKYIGSAYGVVKSSADNNAHFEMRMCDDGVEREFLCVDGLIWNMFDDSSEIMNRDIIKGHSMELWEKSVEGYEDEDGWFHFTGFSFRAACILGDDKEPAMQNSTIEVQFTVSDFIRNIQDELNNKYVTFTKFVWKETEKEGGEVNMPDNKPEINDEQPTDFTTTLMQQFNNVADLVSNHEMFTDRWGDTYSRFSLVDIQDNVAIVVDRKNDYNYYGFAFTMDGDKPVIDFGNAVRKKLCYMDYDEGTDGNKPEGAFNFSSELETINSNAFARINAIEMDRDKANENYSQLKADYDEMKPKYDNYVSAEREKQEAELDAKKDAEFARFEKAMGDNADFIELKSKKADMTVDDITAQCSILYARLNLENSKSNFSKNSAGLTVGINDDDESPVGYEVTKYGNIPVSRN